MALVLVLGAVLTACSAGDGAGTADGIAAAADSATSLRSGPDCLAPEVLAALGFAGVQPPGSTSHPDAPDAGPVPESFVPVSAVLCTTGETLTDASGRWAAVTASRLEGDIHPLADALATGPGASGSTGSSSSRASSGAAGVATSGTTATDRAEGCAATEVRSDLWLVDAVGSAVRVALPGGGCGRLPSAVQAGLDALETVDVERYPVELVAPRATPTP